MMMMMMMMMMMVTITNITVCMFSVFVRLLNHLADVHTHSVAGTFTLTVLLAVMGRS